METVALLSISARPRVSSWPTSSTARSSPTTTQRMTSLAGALDIAEHSIQLTSCARRSSQVISRQAKPNRWPMRYVTAAEGYAEGIHRHSPRSTSNPDSRNAFRLNGPRSSTSPGQSDIPDDHHLKCPAARGYPSPGTPITHQPLLNLAPPRIELVDLCQHNHDLCQSRIWRRLSARSLAGYSAAASVRVSSWSVVNGKVPPANAAGTGRRVTKIGRISYVSSSVTGSRSAAATAFGCGIRSLCFALSWSAYALSFR